MDPTARVQDIFARLRAHGVARDSQLFERLLWGTSLGLYETCTVDDEAVTRNRGLSRSPPHPLLLHTFVAGPRLQTLVAALCRVLQSVIGLSQGGFVAGPPDSVASLVAKRPPGPVARPMFLRRCQ